LSIDRQKEEHAGCGLRVTSYQLSPPKRHGETCGALREGRNCGNIKYKISDFRDTKFPG
jgi:hypothetical protein